MGKGSGSCGSKSDDAVPDPHHKVSIQPVNPALNKQSSNLSTNQSSNYNNSESKDPNEQNQQYVVNESPQSTQSIDQTVNGSNIQTTRASQIELRNAGSFITNEPIIQSSIQTTKQSNTLSPTTQYQTLASPSAVNPSIMQSNNQSFTHLNSAPVNQSTSQNLITYLKKVPLLSKLSEADYHKLAESLIEERFGPGEYVVRQGDDGSTFYLIREGEARVTINPPAQSVEQSNDQSVNQSTNQIELAILKPNDYFGEQALVHNSKRMASVQSINQLVVLSMNRDRFRQLFGSDKLTVNFVKRAAVSAETIRSDDQAASQAAGPAVSAQARVKTDAQLKMLLGAVDRNILFDRLSNDQKHEVVHAMWLDQVADQSIIIKQGDPGSHFYVVESGTFDIYVTPKSSRQSINHSNNQSSNQTPITDESKKVATRGVGESFGELALLYNAPRAATVVANDPSTNSVWVLSRVDFRRIVERGNRQKLAEYESFLKKVTSFEALLDYERSRIAEALEEISYPAGACIVRQNEPGDTFFIVKQGEVLCTLATDAGEEEVARYGPGDYFGERALIAGDRRAATCTAIGPVTCLYLNRDAFSLLLGPMEDIFKRRVEGYSTPRNASPSVTSTPIGSPAPAFPRMAAIKGASSRQSIGQSGNQTITLKPLTITPRFTLGDFKIIGTLGKGSFGHVQLVRHFQSGAVYALKIVSKCQVVKLGQQQHMMDERRAMMSLNSPHLIRLFGTFQDKNAIYMVLEPSLGGELFSVLRARTLFDEPTARFYAAAVVCAFDYMHSKGYIYRDLKPENLLLDSRGYLKITDFGFAKQVGDGRTWTLCGTPDYLAPEVVSGSGHGKGVDWWTLGILLYEMLASYPPFYDEDPMRTYAKIMRGEFCTPSHFTRPARDLIRRLLHPKPTKRLGVVAGGARAVMEHPFFAGFDWNAFQQQTMRSPILPNIHGPEDLSNFDKYPPDNNKFEPYFADPKQLDWTAEF